jgi:hypothetical protein
VRRRLWDRPLFVGASAVFLTICSTATAHADNKLGHAQQAATVTADQTNGGYAIQARTENEGAGAAATPAASGAGADSCPGCKWAVFPACSLQTSSSSHAVGL